MSMLVRGLAAAGLVVAAVATTAAPANASALVYGCVYGDKHVVVELLNKEIVEVCYKI